MGYDLYSEFDVDKHKSTYTNYLEVIITPDGVIHCAIPSHQEYLINYGCKIYNMTREELYDSCPESYYCDFIEYLCTVTNCIAMWNTYMMHGAFLTYNQLKSIRMLYDAKLYTGDMIHY